MFRFKSQSSFYNQTIRGKRTSTTLGWVRHKIDKCGDRLKCVTRNWQIMTITLTIMLSRRTYAEYVKLCSPGVEITWISIKYHCINNAELNTRIHIVSPFHFRVFFVRDEIRLVMLDKQIHRLHHKRQNIIHFICFRETSGHPAFAVRWQSGNRINHTDRG